MVHQLKSWYLYRLILVFVKSFYVFFLLLETVFLQLLIGSSSMMMVRSDHQISDEPLVHVRGSAIGFRAKRWTLYADGVAVMSEAFKKRMDHLFVSKKVVPFLIDKVCCDDCWLSVVSFLHPPVSGKLSPGVEGA